MGGIMKEAGEISPKAPPGSRGIAQSGSRTVWTEQNDRGMLLRAEMSGD
ncbi:MAG: hypothetical protein ACYC7J_03780 [Syntrophales bacterium]